MDIICRYYMGQFLDWAFPAAANPSASQVSCRAARDATLTRVCVRARASASAHMGV